jgi:hypothetical protein
VLLITIFVELRVVAGRSRTRTGSPQAVSRRPCCAVALRRTAWSEHGMASVNQTRPHCVNQMGKTHSKPLAARHGRGTAWARHAMCESVLMWSRARWSYHVTWPKQLPMYGSPLHVDTDDKKQIPSLIFRAQRFAFFLPFSIAMEMLRTCWLLKTESAQGWIYREANEA